MGKQKEIIETMVNTCALALTSYGVLRITQHNDFYGYIALSAGFGLEYFKYKGRQMKIW